ncbi:hypothetical protein [Hymenobacter convexus]|uniref:hypothetical protein n=1 Tax=Hymenobacter sp. CA1UV-4 TaxID=3063782 RepID=UPI002713917A|nr:hypothetical protein [Hymenobacter sp. CA1UV-4]MDO7852586.1 hypothetical protein [Hymenobacter sp. CA1UV-4]
MPGPQPIGSTGQPLGAALTGWRRLDGSTYGNQLARPLMPVGLYQAYTRLHYAPLP